MLSVPSSRGYIDSLSLRYLPQCNCMQDFASETSCRAKPSPTTYYFPSYAESFCINKLHKTRCSQLFQYLSDQRFCHYHSTDIGTSSATLTHSILGRRRKPTSRPWTTFLPLGKAASSIHLAFEDGVYFSVYRGTPDLAAAHSDGALQPLPYVAVRVHRLPYFMRAGRLRAEVLS